MLLLRAYRRGANHMRRRPFRGCLALPSLSCLSLPPVPVTHIYRPRSPIAQVVVPLTTEGSPQRIPFLPPSSSVWDVNGRGNNWAWGYTNAASRLGGAMPTIGSTGVGKKGAAGAKPLLDRALDAIRKHVSAAR
jgi:hypothetical protein